MDLDQLDAERHGPMNVMANGRLTVLPAAEDLHWKVVAAAALDVVYFKAYVWPPESGMFWWQAEMIRDAWVRHNGLLPGDQMRRLLYMLDRFYAGIEYDLHHHLGLSAGQLWRERRWRELLGYIDLFPANSHMNRLATKDEEHMEAIIRATKGESGSGAPSMAEFGQLESMMAVLIDSVNRLTATTTAIANPKGAKPRVQPYPRPETAADKIKNRILKENHESMVAMLLPGRADQVQ